MFTLFLLCGMKLLNHVKILFNQERWLRQHRKHRLLSMKLLNHVKILVNQKRRLCQHRRHRLMNGSGDCMALELKMTNLHQKKNVHLFLIQSPLKQMNMQLL